MPETAESHAYSLTTNRNCVMEISNDTSNYCLRNPQVYMKSGFAFSPPQPTVRNSKTEVCSFTKDDNTASGAVGVLTYELFNIRSRQTSQIVAVMFSVPFDYNFYKNWLALGVFESERACDEKLYDLMYDGKDDKFKRQEADGSALVFSGGPVDVMACMSDEGRAIVKLEVFERQ